MEAGPLTVDNTKDGTLWLDRRVYTIIRSTFFGHTKLAQNQGRSCTLHPVGCGVQPAHQGRTITATSLTRGTSWTA